MLRPYRSSLSTRPEVIAWFLKLLQPLNRRDLWQPVGLLPDETHQQKWQERFHYMKQ